MGSTTPNLGLYKPDVGETGWGTLVDANWDALDADSHVAGAFRSAHQILYADYVNGNDANDGTAPYRAFKTAQAAYNALPAWTSGDPGGGTIELMRGRHDVGTGLVLDKTKPLLLIKHGSARTHWGAGDQQYANTAESVLYSSAGGGADTALVNALTPSTSAGAAPFQCFGVFFDLTGAVNFGFDGDDTTGLRMVNCAGTSRDSTPPRLQVLCRARQPSGTGDASYGRLLYNTHHSIALLEGGRTGGGNFNDWVVAFNESGPGRCNGPIVHITGGTRCKVIYNNFESNLGPVESYKNCYQCVSVGNAGEGSADPWLLDDGCGDCHWFPIGIIGDTTGKTLVSRTNVTAYSCFSRYSYIGNLLKSSNIAPSIRQLGGNPNTANLVGSIGELALVSLNGTTSRTLYVKETGAENSTGGWNACLTGARGISTISDGGTIAHGLGVNPGVALVCGTISSEIITLASTDSTNLTVAIKKRSDGSSGTSQPINWVAFP